MSALMLWHYTTGDLLKAILQSGVVRVARASAGPGERALAWISANQDFEPTAIKAVFDGLGRLHQLTLDQLAKNSGGLARLGLSVDAARARGFQRWPLVAGMARIQPRVIAQLDRVGRMEGANPADWWGGSAIPVSAFERIEYRATAADQWAPVGDMRAAA
jgi:hypothetical protein